jgi:hypothetical protein
LTTTWTAEDLRDHYNERAAIIEFDAGLDRLEAEARAMAEVMAMLGAAPVNKTAVNRTSVKGGRPKVHEDRAAYRREWMRQRRAQAA